MEEVNKSHRSSMNVSNGTIKSTIFFKLDLYPEIDPFHPPTPQSKWFKKVSPQIIRSTLYLEGSMSIKPLNQEDLYKTDSECLPEKSFRSKMSEMRIQN